MKKQKRRRVFSNRKWARRGRAATDFILSILLTLIEWVLGLVVFLSQKSVRIFVGLLIRIKEKRNQTNNLELILPGRSPYFPDAVAALNSLGVPLKNSERAVELALQDLGSRASLEELIKRGLKYRKGP